MQNTVKIALIQQTYHDTKEKTIQTSVEKIMEAAQNGAQLVVLQELHQTEYFCQSEDTKFFAYANDFENGGHVDSLDDISIYCIS